jgi:hypothetical protein
MGFRSDDDDDDGDYGNDDHLMVPLSASHPAEQT